MAFQQSAGLERPHGQDRMGYKGRMTGHGFRALAMSTIKERLGYRHQIVDRQLAHAPKDKVKRAPFDQVFICRRNGTIRSSASSMA